MNHRLKLISRVAGLIWGLCTALEVHALVQAGSNALEVLPFVQGYTLQSDWALQPSGLARCQGELLFVSDKHDTQVFQLTLNSNASLAQVTPWLTLSDLPRPPPQSFGLGFRIQRWLANLVGLFYGADWEGLACDGDGTLYLASESYFSVLQVTPAGEAQWLLHDLYRLGQAQGLFTTHNAYLEGVTLMPGGLILAAERQPRALIFSLNNDYRVERAAIQQTSDALSADYAGLSTLSTPQGPRFYFLDRNQYSVCEFSLMAEVRSCYRFDHIARSPQWGYDAGKYGLAEGLVVDAQFIWIIMDNNGDPRLRDSKDTRPILLQFRNPFSAL